MSREMKDRMVEGIDLQQQIMKYNYENNNNFENNRTPKRHHSGEKRTTGDNYQIIRSDDDETEFQMVSHQRKKFQRGNKEDVYQGQNDVMYKDDNLNHLQQQYTQKRKITTNSRTFVNGEMIAMNHSLKKREQKRNDKQIDKPTNYLNNQFDDVYLDNHRNKQLRPIDQQPRIYVSDHALHYAVEQHSQPININCEPKIIDHKQGTALIKELFSIIENNFRKLNNRYIKPLGFDYWFIDRDDNLQCFTKEIELLVFLCDMQNYPNKLLSTTISPNPPKRLPPQRSIILKYVPRDINIEDIKAAISSKYKSLFNIEEMRGTIGSKTRHVRIDLTVHNDYTRLLNGGVLAIEGQLIEVSEFLAPPRLLICSRCNKPDHIKKECKKEYDLCRRCGENRNQGEHKECLIKCHHCNGDHESTSFQYQLISDFRKELVTKLKNNPNFLPYNVQLFMPTEYRSRGEKNNRILINNTTNAYLQRQKQEQTLSYNKNEWPYLSKNRISPQTTTWNTTSANDSNVWNEMRRTQSDFDLLKTKFEEQEIELNKKYNDHKFKLGSVLSLMSVQIQQQNEGLKSIFTTLNELIPIVTMALDFCQKLSIKTAFSSTDQHEKLLLEAAGQQTQTSITYLNEQNKLISNKHSQLLDNFEKNKQLLQRGVELFISSSE